MPRNWPQALLGSSKADPDPHPGIGGYHHPRGPAGQTGYPGSTSATRENPALGAAKLQNRPARPQRYYGSAVSRPGYPTVPQQQADVIPEPAVNGSLPYQGPDAKTNPDRVRDTEHRPRTIISQGIPGGQRVRNSTYLGGLQAQPGQLHTYRSAGKGRHFPVTEVTVPSRYVFNGVNGGTDALDDTLQARQMPYTGHGSESGMVSPVTGRPQHARGSVRGAVLNGDRLYLEQSLQVSGLGQGGAFGKARRTQRHRPTIFNEPAPRTGRFYDTSANSGGPSLPGSNTQVFESVHVSPRARRPQGGWGSARARGR